MHACIRGRFISIDKCLFSQKRSIARPETFSGTGGRSSRSGVCVATPRPSIVLSTVVILRRQAGILGQRVIRRKSISLSLVKRRDELFFVAVLPGSRADVCSVLLLAPCFTISFATVFIKTTLPVIFKYGREFYLGRFENYRLMVNIIVCGNRQTNLSYLFGFVCLSISVQRLQRLYNENFSGFDVHDILCRSCETAC